MVKINTIPESKRRRKQRLYVLIVSIVFLSATAGSLVYWCSPSLQDIGQKAVSFVGKMSQNSAGTTPAEPVLRGTIYDRFFKELAVSYRLFTLSVYPAEITRREKTIEVLAGVLGEGKEELEARLKSHRRKLNLAEDLDQQQAEAIVEAGLAGVYCNPSEVRFYPVHTSGSQVLGFADQGVGLYGVEAKYDTVLQPGEFRNPAVADIDFGREEVLGRSTTDVVLTLDVELQRLLDKKLRKYLQQQGAVNGMGILLEPFTGKVVAVMSQPTFNPNYYWQANEQVRANRVYRHKLEKSLVQSLLAKAAAIDRDGLNHRDMLPSTVASPDYGLDAHALALFDYKLKLFDPVLESWGVPDSEQGKVKTHGPGPRDTLTGAQIATAVASLINGGWRISPYILEGIYDHATSGMYLKSHGSESRDHVLEPASGIVLRRKLFSDERDRKKKKRQAAAVTSRFTDVRIENGTSKYTMQELYVGMIPKKMPKYLLVMAVDKERLDPVPAVHRKNRITLESIGELVLTRALQSKGERAAGHPQGRSKENFSRFLISKRLDYREVEADLQEAPGQMPELTGMSLRKALQRLNHHQVQLQIRGTGTIVAQVPAPGKPVVPGRECILTLQSEI